MDALYEEVSDGDMKLSRILTHARPPSVILESELITFRFSDSGIQNNTEFTVETRPYMKDGKRNIVNPADIADDFPFRMDRSFIRYEMTILPERGDHDITILNVTYTPKVVQEPKKKRENPVNVGTSDVAFLDTLPRELRIQALSYLSPKQIGQYCVGTKAIREECQTDGFWQDLLAFRGLLGLAESPGFDRVPWPKRFQFLSLGVKDPKEVERLAAHVLEVGPDISDIERVFKAIGSATCMVTFSVISDIVEEYLKELVNRSVIICSGFVDNRGITGVEYVIKRRGVDVGYNVKLDIMKGILHYHITFVVIPGRDVGIDLDDVDDFVDDVPEDTYGYD